MGDAAQRVADAHRQGAAVLLESARLRERAAAMSVRFHCAPDLLVCAVLVEVVDKMLKQALRKERWSRLAPRGEILTMLTAPKPDGAYLSHL